ncbi:nucleolar DEAD-box protein required for synthesis of 60S ribosomal subunit [Coemansia sp. RSA 1813]|nr:nucleolar DEAD-box protein required for synthesis of 60S ribosomal subunit [Coemansia sp. RSA 1646]KAJ1768011.1 nucleolar DEAD-box protein required for synthesis of 60S ribosomal subunit [Coemansia sp. RSA 1843]KAJ2086958.1 nucleolar DEAD-box protein required for synthesis of 60S ribosomal subunit [Coemansia sp. RSA 986]KAJ2211770.1 nucleolar DEAD-box protein required for synthesis of 60S ribosomal subunit [Coemansia sp. RSA 487]KAJ2564350.1 nucleolar DEAD-box protein required for synthesis 
MVIAADDDFIMTIGDNDDVPDLEEVDRMEEESDTDTKPQQSKQKKRKANKNANKGDSNQNKRTKGDDDGEDVMAKNFMIDLEADGFDSVQHTLDFTLARASLKKKSGSGMHSSLDEKIAAVRRSAKKMEKSKTSKEDDSGSEMDDDNDTTEDDMSEPEENPTTAEVESDAEEESEESDSESDNESEDGSESEDSDSSESEVDEQEEARKRAYFASDDEVADDELLPDSFTVMNLSRPIMKGLTKLGFVQPTPIQAKTIPIGLLGKDVCGGAQTGSGKTAAFLVPILERLLYRPKNVSVTRVTILCPTRELAIQCHSVGTKLAAFTDISMCLCIGGLSLKSQEAELRQNPDVVIATPGRLIDHLRNSQAFKIDKIEILVMDEADRMLDDGFEDELTEIIRSCPKKRQTMLFSATMTDNVDKLVRLSLHKPVRIQIDPPKSAVKGLTQEFVRVRTNKDEDRTALLVALCKRSIKNKCIIFFRSKMAAHQMKIIFGLLGLRAAEIHGNLSQEARLQSLEQFRDAHVDYLMATDLAARGLDVKGIDTVINYTMPTQFAQYLHRVGRTARAGRSGRAITLVGESDRKLLKMAVKNSPKDRIKQRVVPLDTLNKYRAKVDSLADQVKEIMDQMREERVMKDAEMQIAKASNMLEHKHEIINRPRRTWFQTTKERQRSKDTSGKEYAGVSSRDRR